MRLVRKTRRSVPCDALYTVHRIRLLTHQVKYAINPVPWFNCGRPLGDLAPHRAYTWTDTHTELKFILKVPMRQKKQLSNLELLRRPKQARIEQTYISYVMMWWPMTK